MIIVLSKPLLWYNVVLSHVNYISIVFETLKNLFIHSVYYWYTLTVFVRIAKFIFNLIVCTFLFFIRIICYERWFIRVYNLWCIHSILFCNYTICFMIVTAFFYRSRRANLYENSFYDNIELKIICAAIKVLWNHCYLSFDWSLIYFNL